MKGNSTKTWNIKVVLIILSVVIMLMLCIPMSAAEPQRTLAIDVIYPQTANVEVVMSLPVNDSTAYEYMVNLFHSEYERGFKEGLEYLFDSKILEYTVVENSSTFSLRFDLTLNGNYTNDFTIKEMPMRYTTYLPLDYDEITISNNSSIITTFTNYVLSMEYKTPLNEGVVLSSQIAPQDAVILPIKNAEYLAGLNSYSKFCIPNYWVGWGDDPVPETGHTASQVAEMYKPYFVKKNSAIDYPDWVFYRVYKGDDPYTDTTTDAFLIMYYGYWCRQDTPPHCNDAEQIYIWVNTIGEDPYKIAYDRWTFWDWHLHHVERVRSGNGATWINISNGDYDHDEMEDVYTQHASYYPQGRRLYNSDSRFGDHFCEVLLNDVINPFDNCHLWVRIEEKWHTYDPEIYDNDGTAHTSYTLYPLDDETLIWWYTTYACCTDLSICEFAADVSDPFHGLFWEDPNVCSPIFPFLSTTIDSALVNNGVLTVDASVLYDNTEAGGSSGNDLRGLWKDRFNATVDGESIGNPYSLDEYEAGRYTLEFDVSGISPGTYTLALNVTDNLDYNFCVDYETVIIQNHLPVASFTYSPEKPIVNQTITLNASDSYDPDGWDITKYEWVFGDGNIADTTEAIITHSYSETGDYIVNLSVEDDEGTLNTTSKMITVHPQAIFDTETPANPYPSIFGIHNGTITPNQTIPVSTLHTYPCEGTGGHTEYARIWNNSGLDVNASWEGYVGDWHSISFSEPFTLVANKTYNYTIKTGSYPQIHHTDELDVASGTGTITCDKFIDANGRVYYDWIPAIKLFL